MQIQRGDRVSGLDPLKNHKNIGFLSNTGPAPWKITKLPSQHSMLGHHWPASEMPFIIGLPVKCYSSSARQQNAIHLMAFCWRADDGLLLLLFGSSFPSSKKTQKTSELDPPLAKLSGSAHECPFNSTICLHIQNRILVIL